MKTIYTVGHSTLSMDSFIEMINSHCVEAVADVRRFPGSARHPQFGQEAMATELAIAGLHYSWLPELGGRRSTKHLSKENGAWRVKAFHAYADHMQTPEFDQGLERLMREADERNTAIMCAEAQWTRCHRRLISDALTARGWKVIHILSARRTELHKLSGFAHVEDGRVTYPSSCIVDRCDA